MRLHLDCDPGCDDAVAIWLALASPGIEVACITTVAGNASARTSAINARRVLDLAGADIQVVAGAERAVPDAVVHGADGLAGLDLPAASRPPDAGDALGLILGARHVVALGPLSNLAAALARAPGWRPETFVWMGGAEGPGNVTPGAEYNAHCDPPAAQAVLQAGLAADSGGPLIVPWDAALQALTTDAHLAPLRGPVGEAAARLLRLYRRTDMDRYGLQGGALPDPLAIAALTNPEMFGIDPVSVRVEADGTTRFLPPGEGPPARLARRVDAGALFAHLAARLASL